MINQGESQPESTRPNMLLSAHVAAMAVTATWMLGMGEQDFALPWITLTAAVCSLLLTDRLRWFRLHRFVANVAMLAAAFASLNSFFDLGSHEQLVAVANLLVYVQIVLLFQLKTARIYGQLMVFSLLQVVVACLLNDRLEFGLLLLLYLIVGMLGMILFFLERETARIGVVNLKRHRQPAGEHQGGAATLLGKAPVLWTDLTPGTVRRALLSRRLIAPILSMVFASLIFVTIFFYTAPRGDGSNWQGGGSALSTVGFSPEVSFQQMGKVLISNERVMRVAFSEADTGEPKTIIGQPYFRGSLLAMYLTAGGRGNWRQDVDAGITPGVKLIAAPDTTELLWQDVLLEPTRRPMLFSVFPVYATADTPEGIRINQRTGILYRNEVSALDLAGEYRFRVATSAFRFGAQLHITPYPWEIGSPQGLRRFRWMLRRLTYIDNPSAFPELFKTADKIVREAAPGGNNYDRAKALERHFLESDLYHYSLDLDEVRRRRRSGVDPIEDFVSNHHTGHCEYFASALALMLRSQGIPARLVIGYHGGDYNYIGNYFVVRQRHAHAWVEAFLKPDEIPTDLLPASRRNAAGGWLRLDPTPASDEEKGSDITVLDRVSKSFDYARWLWKDYVLKLTSTRQQNTPFSAMTRTQAVPLTQFISPIYWRNLRTRIASWDYSRLWRRPFSWQAGLAAIGLYLTCVAVYRLARRLWRFVPRIAWRGWKRRARRRQSVTFYRRLERLLARIDITRSPAQTPRELAAVARVELLRRGALLTVCQIPHYVVDAYYQVRFGHWVPEDAEIESIRRQLDEMKSAILKLQTTGMKT